MAEMLWELPLAEVSTAGRCLQRNNKKEKTLQAGGTKIATETDPSNPFNSLHPFETSVSVAGLGAVEDFLMV
ncbi:MAG TPA: hypothetical protein VGO75_00515 [Gemmatimonadaceae bacterium]|jgi:hypothetical protein|nr:hypothetical protein [Gemmatimonadaceae bacterium]